MKKVLELIGLHKVGGDIGLEIECEGENIQPYQSDVWTIHNDGSLRGRYPDEKAEFVLTKPVPYGRVKTALEELIKAQTPAKFNFGFRTSVHVHLNVQQLTSNQALNVIYTYLLVEELMIKYCGQERVANRFCLRLQDAEGLMQTLSAIFTNGVREIRHYPEDAIRYSSLNIAAIQKYGSVEFRGMRGTLDKKVLMNWVDAIVNIRNYATSHPNPVSIYNEYGELSYEAFVQKVLGDVYKEFLYEGWERDMARSFSLSLELPHLYNIYNPDKEGKKVAEEKTKYPWDIPIHNAGEVERMIRMQQRAIQLPEPIQVRPRRRAAAPVIVDEFPEINEDE